MKYDLLIKGGTVVDGTGAPAFAADVRVGDGRILEVGRDLQPRPRERVVDAKGCYVTPGFIETHNHYDAPMWWMPNMEPVSGYGITTSVNGNCGFTAAPASDDAEARLEMVKIFSFFEDIPIKPFMEVLPWDWRTWSEYKRSVETRLKFPMNFASFVGHIAIRLAVMGLEAWDRKATPDEIARMCAHLRDALDAGALGLSTNLLDYDGQGRAIPSILACDDEFEALLDVLADYPGKCLQVIIGIFMRMTGVADMERMERLAGPRGIRVQWVGAPTYEYQQATSAPLFDMHERFKAQGLDFWTGFHHVPATSAANFVSSLIFGQSNNLVWHEVIAAKGEEAKLALLEDPAWRARARDSWDQTYPQSPFRTPKDIALLETETGFGPIGITLADLAASRGGIHASDALADWVIDNGFRSILLLAPPPKSRKICIDLFRDPRAVGNISDSGAHGQMLCGIGDHIDMLVDFVRETGDLTIEEGIHNLTGKLANHFGFHDRGEIKPGKTADIAVFDLNAIERRPMQKVYDVPDGEGGRTWRYSRPPAPMKLTLVNGVPTFDRDVFTGNFPGRFISQEPAQAELAQAAE